MQKKYWCIFSLSSILSAQSSLEIGKPQGMQYGICCIIKLVPLYKVTSVFILISKEVWLGMYMYIFPYLGLVHSRFCPKLWHLHLKYKQK